MASSSDLFLGGITHRARVLPVVYFSILDHHIRRNAAEVRNPASSLSLGLPCTVCASDVYIGVRVCECV